MKRIELLAKLVDRCLLARLLLLKILSLRRRRRSNGALLFSGDFRKNF